MGIGLSKGVNELYLDSVMVNTWSVDSFKFMMCKGQSKSNAVGSGPDGPSKR